MTTILHEACIMRIYSSAFSARNARGPIFICAKFTVRAALSIISVIDYHKVVTDLSCYSSIFIYFVTYKMIFIANCNSKTDRCWFLILLSEHLLCIIVLIRKKFNRFLVRRILPGNLAVANILPVSSYCDMHDTQY